MGHKALERHGVDCCVVSDGSAGLFWQCLLVARLDWLQAGLGDRFLIGCLFARGLERLDSDLEHSNYNYISPLT